MAVAITSVASASEPVAASSTRRAAPTIRIELRPIARVDHADVRLGDVCALVSSDSVMQRRLRELPLGRAPGAGRVARIDRQTLTRWIRAHTGIDPDEITWAGPPAAEVRLAVRRIPAEAIARAAEARLRPALSVGGRRVELDLRRVPTDVAAPAGRLRLEARPVPATRGVPRRLSVWVDVWVDDRFVRTVPAEFEVGVFGPGLVTTRAQGIGDILDPAALAIREVEWSGRQAPPLDPAAPEARTRLRLRRPVAAGGVIERADVEPAPSVTRGEWALLRAEAGRVTVESRAEVLQDGRPGETVRVHLANAAASILARVKGPGTLEVEP